MTQHLGLFSLEWIWIQSAVFVLDLDLSFRCPLAHRAFTDCFHFSRSTAATHTSFDKLQRPFFHSLSIVLCHVVLGPSFSFFLLVPMSMQRFHHSLDFWSFISISPIIFHLLALTSLLSDFIWARSNRSSVLICVCLLQWTRRIPWRHLFWNMSTSLFIFQVSHPHNRYHKSHYSFSFVFLKMCVDRQIAFEYAMCGWGNFRIRKEVVDLKISGFMWTGPAIVLVQISSWKTLQEDKEATPSVHCYASHCLQQNR